MGWQAGWPHVSVLPLSKASFKYLSMAEEKSKGNYFEKNGKLYEIQVSMSKNKGLWEPSRPTPCGYPVAGAAPPGGAGHRLEGPQGPKCLLSGSSQKKPADF